jgi:hypothetical protein
MIEPTIGASTNPGIEVIAIIAPALVAEPVSLMASHGKAMKTIEPETTLNIEDSSVMTIGVRRGLVMPTAEDNF